MLDGDNVRHGLNKNLGFSAADREENIRRIGEVLQAVRRRQRHHHDQFHRVPTARTATSSARPAPPGKLPFIEIHVATPIETTEQRDPKGFTRRPALTGFKNFTGIDDPYEVRVRPEFTLDATSTSPLPRAAIL